MSQLPPFLREAVERRASSVPFAHLKTAAARLSEAYRAGKSTEDAGPAAERTAAYLAVRFPATYAAALAVMRECAARIGPVRSVLDLGAGCGAATLAAREVFPALEAYTLVEPDASLAEAGREFLRDADWRRLKMENAHLPEADLVIAAYSLNELGAGLRDDVIVKAWAAARRALVIIEPGSPAGFQIIRSVRDKYAAFGRIAAPCPNTLPCPITPNDWCHFAARVERMALHRRLKEGSESYEDEKFSYIALCKQECTSATARIIARPEHAPGHIHLRLCADGKIANRTVTKRDKAAFRAARKAAWGETFEF